MKTLGTATYSPEDNKLRLYPFSRLDSETYAKVRAMGFIWAPKQELFVAPMWTPDRADFLEELCGEIEDEDKSLVDRAEERADRFEDYSDKRTQDAERAHAAVEAIASGIPMGQPILVGHHSEKRARRDAEKIDNGMRKAVKMWDTAKYWERRAAGAIHAAKYKERPDVRARRIKTLEADRRRHERQLDKSKKMLKFWNLGKTAEEYAKLSGISEYGYLHLPRIAGDSDKVSHEPTAYDILSNSCPTLYAPRTLAEIIAVANDRIPRGIEFSSRWIQHIDNRITYERAMLNESGGTAADKVGPEVGGACRCWASPNGGFSYIRKVNKVSVTVEDNWGNGGSNFTRTIEFDKLHNIMTVKQVQEARDAGKLIETEDKRGFFLKKDTPTPAPADKPEEPENKGEKFEAMRESVRAGVQVVSAPELFPTPEKVADFMVQSADVRFKDRILEPSAGTGNIIHALLNSATVPNTERTAVEIRPDLAKALGERFPSTKVVCADFLTCNGDLGKFDKVLMNPPFSAEVEHVRHAFTFLKPGGRLVAVMSEGPFYRSFKKDQEFREFVEEYGYSRKLPEASFRESGTAVNTRIVVLDAPLD